MDEAAVTLVCSPTELGVHASPPPAVQRGCPFKFAGVEQGQLSVHTILVRSSPLHRKEMRDREEGSAFTGGVVGCPPRGAKMASRV